MAGTVRPSDVRLLYRQVVLPAIAYASPIWRPERPDCRLRSRLLSVQRSVLLALTGAYKTTRTAALQLLLHAPPIELELWRLNREFTLFVLRQPVECDGHTYAADNVALPLDRWTRHPSCAPQERPVCRLSVQQARATARQYGLHVYTDGSHTSLSSGAAYVVFGRGTSTKAVGRYRVYGATSAYAAELVAFTEALVYLRSSASRMPAFVYTDCLSVLQAIASPYCLDPRVNHLRELMAQISASRPLRAFHVPGHRGLFGNELADYLAERACRVGLVRTVPQSVRDVRERFRHDMIETWARDWSVHHTSTELFKWTPDVRQLPAFYPPNRNLVTLLTGHGRFPCYFYRFGLMEEATCPCGGQCENLDHYYTVCPMTAPLVALMRHSADLATDDRRRVLADDRNRALLTQLVTTISELTLNDALSLPTFETLYSASWIDLTFATPSVLSAGYEWLVTDDTTYSEHRLVEVRVGAPDGTQTSTHLESAALLLRTQIAVDDPATDETSHALTRALAAAPYTSAYEDVPFTYTEVVDVLRNTPNKSAAGPDLISPVIMKALFRFHPHFFLLLFNASLALGYFPRCWRRARVSFIHKPGRPPERTSSYRPICEHLTRLKINRMPALLMSLDFHGAFDSVWHPLVLRYFPERALPSGLYHLLRTFLEGRSVFLQSHAGQVEANPTLGSPQGSPLSPLLWNVAIDSLLSLSMPPGVLVQAYADDTIIVVPAPSRDALGNLASDVLRRVIRWSRDVKVSLNCDKTFCVLFSHGVGGMERVHPVVRLAPGEPTLQFREHLRILGVIFDRRLSFFPHADYLRQKVALLASRVATFFAMQRCYVRPTHKIVMYRQVILPALTYGSPVWWSEDRVDCRLQARIITVQRVALLALTRAYRTTSTAALQVLMRAPPIDLELERVNAEFRLFTLRRHIAFGACRFRPSWVADAHQHTAIHPHWRPSVMPSRTYSIYVYCCADYRALCRCILPIHPVPGSDSDHPKLKILSLGSVYHPGVSRVHHHHGRHPIRATGVGCRKDDLRALTWKTDASDLSRRGR
ncbi:hypothetical protein HPB52_023737 [Rhipicephalus sanguineus]|uniref:Tick transposon n=1 Tax=Rhipicephalus sanguineus TaxID=34632 RepID=A0A9D4Q3S2_RHISA|nr:hypothetical protein HPB52_023737 [Rhipicephalus sanguineus]